MTYQELEKTWGSQKQIGDALGYSQTAVSYWKRAGIPLGVQLMIEGSTNGRMKADRPRKRRK